MPGWNEVFLEIEAAANPFKAVRQKYLSALSDKLGKNIIAYYSGWLQKPNISGLGIEEVDKNAFMSMIHKMDRSKGLALILHTPGGDLCACESIIAYLKMMFQNDITMIVPQIAMSAGTLMCCAGKEIYMGKQSSLGPIDPQFNGIPAQGILEEFKKAQADVKEDITRAQTWGPILSKYHPSLLGECEKAIDMASDICKRWLQENMLASDSTKEEKANHITQELSSHENSKTHARRFDIKKCKEIGLKIIDLEQRDANGEDVLQDLVLTIHHAYMHTFSSTNAIKIVENSIGVDLTTRIR
ncbi:MAG: ATP-dependent Clp protease proteolytic subunit [Elusimicrobia bacterium]|nr:ATP-dependent Clp protease proteolytic subunit [Elusimicrobiota bacterium]